MECDKGCVRVFLCMCVEAIGLMTELLKWNIDSASLFRKCVHVELCVFI